MRQNMEFNIQGLVYYSVGGSKIIRHGKPSNSSPSLKGAIKVKAIYKHRRNCLIKSKYYCLFVLIYFQRDATLHSLFVSGKLLYMFQVVSSPIIRSTYNCIYNIWYLLTVRDNNKLLVICV